jgi:hypothetical protein
MNSIFTLMEEISMWYYTLNNQQFGPVDEAKIKEMIATGAINASTMVWSAGMPSWVLIGQSPLAGLVSNLPPAPPPAYYAPVMIDPRVKKINDLFMWFWISLAVGGGLILLGSIFSVIGAANFSIGLAIVGTIFMALSSVGFLASVVLFFILIYKAWGMVQDGEARTTPDQAVAFCGIPGWNFYWIFPAFKGLAKDLNRVMAKEQVFSAPVKEDIALWFCIMILATPLGLPAIAGIVFWIMFAAQVKKAMVALTLARK